MLSEVHEINEEAYEEWRDFRQQEKKIKIGPVAEKKQKKFLAQYPPPIQQDIVDQSIMNSYQGLFAPKGKPNAQDRPSGNSNQTGRRLTPAERVEQRHNERYGRQSGAGSSDLETVVEIQ
jgi:hypothetical protein